MGLSGLLVPGSSLSRIYKFVTGEVQSLSVLLPYICILISVQLQGDKTGTVFAVEINGGHNIEESYDKIRFQLVY